MSEHGGNGNGRRKPFEEHVTVRLDADLFEALEREQARREELVKFRISRSTFLRIVLRNGLETMKHEG